MSQASLEAARAAEEQCLEECEALRQQLKGDRALEEDLQQQKAQNATLLHELNHTLRLDSALRGRTSELEEANQKLEAANAKLSDSQNKLQAQLQDSHASNEVCPMCSRLEHALTRM